LEFYQLGEHVFEVYHNPGRSLHGPKRERVVSELVSIAKKAFGPGMGREEVEKHVLPVRTLIVAKYGNETVGFTTNDIFKLPKGKKLLYLVGTAVSPEQQHRKMYSVLRPFSILLELTKGDAHYFGSRTQNPIVYAALGKLNVYPREGEATPPHLVRAAKKLASQLSPNQLFDEKRLVHVGCYGRPLYKTTPRHHDPKINEFMDKYLNYERGDGLVMVNDLNPEEIKHIFIRNTAHLPEEHVAKVLKQLEQKRR